MSLPSLKRRLAIALAILTVGAVFFYLRQNAGLQAGGPISLVKMIWLTWAIAAWFVMPPFLWRDERLQGAVRRLFGLFWLVMMVRGIAEVIAIYGFGHWHPWYGIGHDVFCLGLLMVLYPAARRDAVAGDEPNRHALGFVVTLMVSLVAEIAFAGMFLQTGAAGQGIYFASAAASWGYINLVTLFALFFLVPDLVAALTGLYFPGRGVAGPWTRRTRGALAIVTVVVAVAALAFWTWMEHQEARAKRYADVGFGIYQSCGKFANAFQLADQDGMADFIAGGEAAWRAVELEQGHPMGVWQWQDGGAERSFLELVRQWREDLGEVLQVAFKIHLVDEVISAREAVVQFRFEVTGRYKSDYGMIRARFLRGTDDRWRIAESALMDGVSVAGPGDHFVDVASVQGPRFTMQVDRRFTPGESCASDEERAGQRKLKFETMRHAYAGAATGDYDGDGWDDVFLCSGGRSALFRNQGEAPEGGLRFVDVTAEHPFSEAWHINMAGFADLDNDGDQDLFLGSYYGPNYLFANDGMGHFTDVSAASGLAELDQITTFSFFDYDGDGDLDLYLGRYLDAETEIPGSFLYARNGMPDRLFENLGELRFRDVSAAAGVGDVGLALSLAAADYDLDGDQDLYVANDFGRNVLYQNQGKGADGQVTFRDVARETGTLAIGGSMSAGWGDFDGDGRFDLYVAAIRSNQRWFVQPITAQRVVLKFLREGKLGPSNPLFSDLKNYMGDEWIEIGNHALGGNSLLLQRDGGVFAERAEAAGARPAGWYWSSALFDIDHDGDLDIYATDGWITGKNAHDL